MNRNKNRTSSLVVIVFAIFLGFTSQSAFADMTIQMSQVGNDGKLASFFSSYENCI